MTISSSNTDLLPVCPKKPQEIGNKPNKKATNQLNQYETTDKFNIQSIKDIVVQMFIILKPDWKKIIVFIGFIIIYAGGTIQSWAFTDLEDFGYPPPPFYDLVRLFPFWLVWILTLIPLAIPYWLFGQAAYYILSDQYRLFVTITLLAYYYILSCLIISLLEYKRKVDSGKIESRKLYRYFFGGKKLVKL